MSIENNIVKGAYTMKKRVKNIMIGLGLMAGTAVTAGTVSYALTKSLMEVALDRKEPELVEFSRQQLTQSPKLNQFLTLRKAAALKLEEKPCEIWELTAHDGTNLVGHWLPCTNAKRIIIAMHGWRSSWTSDFGLISDFLHRNDCSVLFVEQRGQNNSGGEHMGFGLIERYDCRDWVNLVNEKEKAGLPIYLCGVSMGASTVLMAAGFRNLQNVHGIIADCGYTSPHEIWKYVVSNNLHLHYNGLISEIADDICREKIKFSSKDYSCLVALESNEIPVLFIHGTDDDFVPIEMTYENYKACIAPKCLLVVPGAGHGMSYVVDRERYESALIDFWKNFD